MKYIITLSISLLLGPVFSQKIPKPKTEPLAIGEKVELRSKILNEDRILNIYLPNGYSSDSTKIYPVIYLLDGSIDEDFIHISGLVQFGSFSWINILPESIVVGIANVDRQRDFTYPASNPQYKEDIPTSGGAEAFVSFIEKELQPFVLSNYHADSTSTLLGQSLGGLMATEILFKKPDMFDNYIIVSPSLWWDDESLLSATPMEYNSNKSVYIAVGQEGDMMERVARSLHVKLLRNKADNTRLFFDYFEEHDHGDVLHNAAYSAFEKIFGKEE